MLITCLSRSCCKVSGKSASCICPLLLSCYDQMTHEPICISISFKDALFLLQTEYKSPLAPVCRIWWAREGEEDDLPKDIVFSEDALRCSSALQLFHQSSPTEQNQHPGTGHHHCPCSWWPHHKTHTCNWEISDAFLLNLHNPSTYHTLSRGGALQFLGIKYTLTVACFYEPLLAKVKAISLRLVMINATAHLPPSWPNCLEKKLHSCAFNKLCHFPDTLEQMAVC